MGDDVDNMFNAKPGVFRLRIHKKSNFYNWSGEQYFLALEYAITVAKLSPSSGHKA